MANYLCSISRLSYRRPMLKVVSRLAKHPRRCHSFFFFTNSFTTDSMKSFTLLSLLAASTAALDPSSLSAILPTAKPTATDDWFCALSAYSPYFDPPKPTGTLLSALQSYGDKLLESCTEKRCPYPDATSWCGFTTAAPTAALPAYTSYASSASVWWANHSSSAMELAQECPWYWYDALTDKPSTGGWLNMTIINAECLAAAAAPGSSSKIKSATVTFSTLSSLATTSAKPSSAASASSSVATSSAATQKISTDGKNILLRAFVSIMGLVLLL